MDLNSILGNSCFTSRGRSFFVSTQKNVGKDEKNSIMHFRIIHKKCPILIKGLENSSLKTNFIKKIPKHN